jgi:hypothetical protein
MNQAKALEEIGKGLARLTYEVSQENFSGQFSKNRISEDLLLPIFSRIFAAPALHNLNTATQNHPYLDLADDTARIGIQVTTEKTAAKITKTLDGVVAAKLNQQYDRIIVFLLCQSRPQFTAKTKSKWAAICAGRITFLPERDIVALPQLLSLIQSLDYSQIIELRDIISKSVIGEEYVDVLGQVRRVSNAHLEYEKRTGRYIPGVFVETRETKQLARCFCHPVLFFQRSTESTKLLNLLRWNRFLDRAGLPPLPVPDFSTLSYEKNLPGVCEASKSACDQLESLLVAIKEYKNDERRASLASSVPSAKRAFFDQNAHVVRNELQTLPYDVNDILDELKLPKSPILMLTGRAGQGKTNLLCDLVENFLFKHEIPCAFISGRELGLKQSPDLGRTICEHLFGSKVTTIDEAWKLLSVEALRLHKPFVLIIDGLNEHRNIFLFAQQLEIVVDAMLQYPGLRCLFSCRSEFFEDRFAPFVNSHLSTEMFICNATEGRLEDEERSELVILYFTHFGIDESRVAEEVRKELTRDMLLLRFFCETYGSRGKDRGYVQPDIRHFYRDELFERYLERKLKTADLFLQTITTAVSPISTSQSLQRVLEICLERMISTWEFSNVPMSIIPGELQAALYSLLDEELIIRQDVARDEAFAATSDALNFTFDEFRDYMLAQYLLHRVFPRDRGELASLLNKSDEDRSQPTEGLKKFLFYAARKRTNAPFYHFYQSLSWYTDVYDTEVFNLDVRVLDDCDHVQIRECLATNDYRAAAIAKRLSYRWNESYWRLLNLGLLLEFMRSATSEVYGRLILQNFGARRRADDDCLGVEFCTFATEIASRQDFEDRLDDFRPLAEFLILLLPVERTSLLGSPAYDALMNFLRRSAGYTTNLLLESLDYTFDDHRPFVWRLLYEAFELTNDERITVRATSALGNRSSLRREELTEVERIVQHRSGEGMSADDVLTEIEQVIRHSDGKRRTGD